MPTQKYALKKGGHESLHISRGMFSQSHEVVFKGKELGTITKDRLKLGWVYNLDEGRLTVQEGKGIGVSRLDVRLNDKPLPGSALDPAYRLTIAYQPIFFIAVINILFGIFTFLSGSTPIMGFTAADGFFQIITGAIYGVLGYFVRRRSYIALVLTLIGFCIDSLFVVIGIIDAMAVGASFGSGIVGGLVIRVFFFLYMLQGFNAIRQLKQQGEADAVVEEPEAPQSNFPLNWPEKQPQSFFEPDAPKAKTLKSLPPPPKKANKLSQVEMILIGVVGVLVVVVIGIVAIALSSNNATSVAASLPTVAVMPTQAPPTNTPTSTPNPTPFPYGTILEIPRDTIDIAYSPALGKMVAVYDDRDMLVDDTLYVYDLLTRTESLMPTCQYPPANIVLDAAGEIAAIGYEGGVCIIDLLKQEVLNDYEIDPNYTVSNQIITDDGWLYFSLQDAYRGLHGLHALNLNQPLSVDTFIDYTGASPFSMAGESLYMPLPYEDFKLDVWDLSAGKPTRKYQWEFGDSYNVCSQAWISSDDRYLFNHCGQAFEMNASGREPTYVDQLASEDERLGVLIENMVDVVSAGRIIIIGTGSPASVCSDTVYIYDRATFDLQTHYKLPVDTPCAERIFMDRDGVHYYILTGSWNLGDFIASNRFLIGDLLADNNR